MNKPITFRMVSYTDPAGKYNEGAPNSGNEDNFYVDDNLGDDLPSHCLPDEQVEISDCGMLMAVADGMGGMNAGEVASQIAIDTVTELFAPGRITAQMAQDPQQRRGYLEDLIREADRRIKKQAAHNRDQEGMGSTIILAWLVGDALTVSWCGDSRCYRFNPVNGIEMLSEDHSYVQDLVRKGVLRYELTFDHPQGNIVTRSLGDPGKEAQPETREYTVCNNDIILLCSDGLSGVLRDRKTYDIDGQLLPGDNIEDILMAHGGSMRECREALWEAAERADWYDNVTVILCQITGGAATVVPVPRTVASLGPIGGHKVSSGDGGGEQLSASGVSVQQGPLESQSRGKKRSRLWLIVGIVLCVLIGAAIGLKLAGVIDFPWSEGSRKPEAGVESGNPGEKPDGPLFEEKRGPGAKDEMGPGAAGDVMPGGPDAGKFGANGVEGPGAEGMGTDGADGGDAQGSGARGNSGSGTGTNPLDKYGNSNPSSSVEVPSGQGSGQDNSLTPAHNPRGSGLTPATGASTGSTPIVPDGNDPTPSAGTTPAASAAGEDPAAAQSGVSE